MSVPTNTTSNNQSDLITLNIYNNQNNKNEESKANINDAQANPINSINNNDMTKWSLMQPQNNYLYLDNIRGNNYPYSDNFRNQMYPNNNLNAYNQFGYNGQNNVMANMNNNSPNGNPVKILDNNIQKDEQSSQTNTTNRCSKNKIICLAIVAIICIAMAVAMTTSIK